MNVSKWLASAVIGVIAVTFAADVEAQRRLGGGKNIGKQSPQMQQRQATPPQQQTPPAQQAAPAQQPGTAAAPTAAAGTAAAAGAARAASPMRNMLIGAAAGLGLMALASWLGFGETFATILLFLLLGLGIMMVIGFIVRRSMASGPRPAYGGVGGHGGVGNPSVPQPQRVPEPLQRAPLQPTGGVRPGSAMDEFLRGGAVNPATPWGVPAGFDTEGFLANAKTYFGKLQKSWDSGDLGELQEFTTNEMFIALTHELRGRAGNTTTEVVELDAKLLGIESTPTEHVASVRFTGTLKVDGEIEAFDEAWNLSKSADGKSGWLLAGIQQLS
ncbi:MAG: Tim44 domain-containing protein [Betaproteobacteria bacterium]